MKISSASKKVLASALSAAVVVAFAPTVALADAWHYPYEPGTTGVFHEMDNGTITKAATCSTEGYTTYKCLDEGCDYSYVRIIEATGKHVISADLETEAKQTPYDGVNDGINWTSKSSATAYFKCEGGEKITPKPATIDGGKVTKAPTFAETGVMTYTATATYEGKTLTSTFTEPIAMLTYDQVRLDVTDNATIFKINLLNLGKQVGSAIVGTYSKEVVASPDCATKEVSNYKVEFQMPKGVDAYAVASDLAPVYTDYTFSATPDGKVIAKWTKTGATNMNVHKYNVTGISLEGESITLDKFGKLANGTATTDPLAWTVTATAACTHTGVTDLNDEKATSVTKEQIAGAWVYTVNFGKGGTYKFYAGTPVLNKAGDPVIEWKIDRYGDNAGTTVTYSDVAKALDGINNTSFVAYAAKADIVWTTSYAAMSYTKSDYVAATCEADGKYTATVKIDKGGLNYAFGANGYTNTATADYTAKTSGVIAQLAKSKDHFYYMDETTIKWNADKTAAFGMLKCSGNDGIIATADDVEIDNKYFTSISTSLSVSKASGNRLFAGEEITYSAVVTPGVELKIPAGSKFSRNADGTYSYNETIATGVTADFVGDLDTWTTLPTEAAVTTLKDWTVTDGAGKMWTPTKVEANAALTKTDKCGANDEVSYTLTYNGDKTTTVTFVAAHTTKCEWAFSHYEFDGNEVDAVYACTKCGKTDYVKSGDHGTTFSSDPQYFSTVTLRDGSEVDVYYEANETAQYTWNEAVFTWDEYNEPYATITAVEDKNTVIELDYHYMKVEKTFDAAANAYTYTATIYTAALPTGYKGATTATKTVKLHEGDSLTAVETVEPTATKAGYVKYYCNNCDEYFVVEIPATGDTAGEAAAAEEAAKHVGHDLVQTTVAKATTVDAGYIVNFCNTDQKSYVVAIAADDVALAKTSATVKAKKAKKTAQITVNNAKGKVSYKVASKTKKAGVSVSSTGKVTVKKGTKKGSYKVTVKVAATQYYSAVTKTFTVKVK